MTVVFSFSSTTDGYLTSTGDAAVNPYQEAVGGADIVVDTALASVRWGQRVAGSLIYNVYQAFFRYPYTLDSSSLVTAAYFRFKPSGASGTAVNRDLEVREYDWGTSLTAADWRTPAQLGALTQLAEVVNANTAPNFSDMRAGGSFLLTRLGTTGEVRVVVCSSRNRSQNTPAGDEYAFVRSSDVSGTSEDPALIYTTAPQSRLAGVLGAQAQLSDGTHVFLEAQDEDAGSVLLRHHDGSSATTIATLLVAPLWPDNRFWGGTDNTGAQNLALVVDASDNIYVIGALTDLVGP